MNIIVLIKQVPNTSDVKLDPKTGNLVREGIESIINPDDLHAVETALRIREVLTGTVTVMSMGPRQAIDAITEAMGMGADRGVLLCDKAFAGADTWATAFTLGKGIEKIRTYDLVICGRQAIDGDTAQIGPQVADFLGLTQVTYVYDLEKIDVQSMVVKRRVEEGSQRVRCRFPALVTVLKEIGKPRYPVMGKLIGACRDKAPIKIWNAADIGVVTSEVGFEGSLTHVVKTFAPKFERKGELLEGDPATAVGSLMGKLRENRLI
ncbi:MAG: electron transfer flavoprotein subunit beta/FixA family protein [Desulfobacterales bacterium]|nr:electron transfer flavoprotein subunit beta/FixA family protein [Desulfobacterales bacterium]